MPRWTTGRWFASLVAKMRCGRPSADRQRAPSKRAPRSIKKLQNKGVPKSSFPATCSATCSKSPSAPSSASLAGFSSFPATCSATCSGKSPSAPSSASAGFSSLPATCSATCCSGKFPSPTSSASPQSMDERRFRDRFNYWYKITALGGAVMAFLYGELKSNIEKEVDNKMKEKELKEKKSEIEKKDVEIEHLQTRLKENKRSWWFF